jgi:hypothetical protein
VVPAEEEASALVTPCVATEESHHKLRERKGRGEHAIAKFGIENNQ